MEDRKKQQDEIIKADIKSVEKLWKEVTEDNTLAALLEKMTKDELVKISRKYGVKGITTLKKADAVERVKSVILEKANMSFELMEEDTLRFLEALVKDNGNKKFKCDEMIFVNYLRNRGLVFAATKEEELFVILPEELREIIKASITREVRDMARLNSEVIRAIAGITYYYGVVSFNQVILSLQAMFTNTLTEEYIKSIILNGEELGYDYVVEGDILTHIDVEDGERIVSLQNECNNDYYKFDKKSLIIAGKPDFVEDNKQGKKLEKVMAELFVIDKNILKEEMDGFIVAIKNEVEIQEAIDIFLEAYQIESDEERKIFEDELEIFAKSIRRWSLKGYTEDELTKAEARVVNEVKIGRNDPCICGSGKKYKKCCGK